jgi:MAPEG family
MMHMTSEQKIVAIGAACGVALMLAAVWALTIVLPVPGVGDDVSSRLAYALGANVFALIPFFTMLIIVGNQRFFSDAIDPTRHAEDAVMEINDRVADNTLQQNFVFAVATLGLSTIVPSRFLQIVWACAIWFVIARFAFWIGYRIYPLYRAPGMAGTAYMNLGVILYVVYHLVTHL